MRVAFQGVHGAYSEVAARRFFGKECATLPCESFGQVFRAVELKQAERGIIPIENSLAGSIHENFDLLLSHKLHIVGEIHLPIKHVLMCHPSSSFKKITQVRSHPQALAQCAAFFAQHRKLKPQPYFDTAGAAKSLADEGVRDVGAIASVNAAKLYGLRILSQSIESNVHNFTRFLIVGKTRWKSKRGLKSKSSIVFAPNSNQAGTLFQILGVFYCRNIDLLKIESRPDPHSPFEYMFYLDIEGSPSDKQVALALEHLQEKTKLFRLLGVYPMGKGAFYGASHR
jgi:prephenate dehydratase